MIVNKNSVTKDSGLKKVQEANLRKHFKHDI
uniref:Uncharacterized protein n=1 Tax=Rhizophora mucronata TaxID=61149 RepID=A0A2P2QPN7_RHIMU